MVLDLSCDTRLVDPVLLNTPNVGQSRRVKDLDLGKRLRIVAMFINFRTYHHTVLTRKLVKVGFVGQTLVLKTTMLVGVVENVEVVVIDIVAGEDIGNEFQD